MTQLHRGGEHISLWLSVRLGVRLSIQKLQAKVFRFHIWIPKEKGAFYPTELCPLKIS